MPRTKRPKKPGDRRGTNPNSLKNLIPLKPGETHNRAGINRKTPFSDAALKFSNMAIPAKMLRNLNVILGADAALPEGTTFAEAVNVRLLLNAIVRGDVSAAREVADRLEGHPRQTVALSTDDDRLKRLIESFDRAADNPPSPPSPDSGSQT